MIPQGLNPNITVQVEVDTTWKINIDKNTVSTSTIKELEAVKQAIYLILNTERYDYLIYSWRYGVEFKDLVGEQPSKVISEIQSRVTEALIIDDRIEAVSNFIFTKGRGFVTVMCTAETVYGNIEIERVVNI